MPYFYAEYKVIKAFADYGADFSAEDLVTRCDWGELAWGEQAAMNADGTPSISIIPEVGGLGEEYTTALTANANTGYPHFITYTAARRRVRVRVRMRSPANALGMMYQLRTRQLAADSAGGYALASEVTSVGTCGAEGTDVTLYEDELGPPPPPNDDTGYTVQQLTGGVGIGIEARLVGAVIGAYRVKHGFHAYQETAPASPAIYRRETASGGSPGCEEQGLPERTYEGAQDYLVGDSPIVTLSEDALSSGLMSGAQATDPHDLPESGDIAQTATTRTVSRPFSCDGEALADVISPALSSELTTSAFRSAAHVALSAGLSTAMETIGDPDYAGYSLLGDNTRGCLAEKILSPGETTYTLSASAVRLGIGACRVAAASATITVAIQWERLTRNRISGATGITAASETAVCHRSGSFDSRGQSYLGAMSAPFTVEATDGQEILFGRVYCADPRLITSLALESYVTP